MCDSIGTIQQYAASCYYQCKNYLGIDGDTIVIADSKTTRLSELVTKMLHIYNTCSEDQRVILRHSIKLIQKKLMRRLEEKSNSLFNAYFPKSTNELAQAIEQMDVILNDQLSASDVNEGVFRLKFLTTIPEHLKVTKMPAKDTTVFQWRDGTKDEVTVDEWELVRWISYQVFESDIVQSLPEDKRWEKYFEIMSGAYRGDHILIEEDRNHSKTKEFEQFGSIIRVSSHDEHGRVVIGWRDDGHPEFGSNKHQDLLYSDVPHKGITGNHVKHILFYPADRRELKNGELICAKTARQVDRLAKAGNLFIEGRKIEPEEVNFKKKRHFLALQFEYAPDSDGFNFFDRKFYQHRVYGFLLYQALKMLGVKHANVGPYGFGQTDEHPVILTYANQR